MSLFVCLFEPPPKDHSTAVCRGPPSQVTGSGLRSAFSQDTRRAAPWTLSPSATKAHDETRLRAERDSLSTPAPCSLHAAPCAQRTWVPGEAPGSPRTGLPGGLGVRGTPKDVTFLGHPGALLSRTVRELGQGSLAPQSPSWGAGWARQKPDIALQNLVLLWPPHRHYVFSLKRIMLAFCKWPQNCSQAACRMHAPVHSSANRYQTQPPRAKPGAGRWQWGVTPKTESFPPSKISNYSWSAARQNQRQETDLGGLLCPRSGHGWVMLTAGAQ